ncbi:hypothetical protein OROMI_005791 [Orobanche minor]
MMSTIVYQNLVSSCFEYPHTETTITTTLKLKVAPPSVALDLLKKQGTDIDHSANLEFENWGFLQTVPKESGDNYKESNQTNPWVDKKAQFSSLSQESLELCTENLGSETGSDNTITDGGGAIFPYPSPPLVVPRSEYSTSPTYPNRKAASNYGETKNFPPPLTTMSGGSSLKVRRHREEGRLTVEVVEAPFRNPYLKAERSDGRLRLCFLTAGGEETTYVSAGDEEDDDDGGGGGETAEEEEIEEARSEVKSEFREESEFDGEINTNLEHELEKFPLLSRCKGRGGGHGNKGLCSSNWEPALWVAIS